MIQKNRNLKILSGLLVVQIALAVVSLVVGSGGGPRGGGGPVFAVDATQIDRISIEAGGVLTLVKKDGRWVLPDLMDFPADQGKLEGLLGKLSVLKAGWPVGRTKAAAKQMKVAEESFDKKIVFYKGENEEKALYLGTSPGLKQVHARTGDSESIYAVALNSADWSVQRKDWQDKDYYKLSREDVAKIALPGFKLVNDAGEFKIEDLDGSLKMDPAKTNPLVDRLIGIDFVEVLGKDPKKEYGLEKSPFVYTVQTKGNEDITYTLSPPYEKDFAVLKVSKYPYYFKVRLDQTKEFREKKKDDLVVAAGPAEGEEKKN